MSWIKVKIAMTQRKEGSAKTIKLSPCGRIIGFEQGCQSPIVSAIGQVEAKAPCFGDGEPNFARPHHGKKSAKV
jgi:hypothetical protein